MKMVFNFISPGQAAFMFSYRALHDSLTRFSGFLVALTVLTIVFPAMAAEPVSVSGIVTDPSGAVVVQAQLTMTGASSAVQLTAETNQDGKYRFSVPTGVYQLALNLAGFEPYTTAITAGHESLQIDIKLAMAKQSESMNVLVEAPLVDITTTQSGDVLHEKQLTAIPINGRSFTDALALQPGIVPASSAQANAVVMSGCTSTPPSGDLNAGNMSVSGQRETANGFSVNGSIVEEDFNNGAAVVPNLDSIQEFTVLTNNFNAEYGNFSGGQVAVTTKSGTDRIHGSVFEFLRNTNLDSRNYFATSRATYDRNQFGGTLGGPIRKNSAYYFIDYQGTVMTQGQNTGNIAVPSLADRGGNLSDLSTQLTGNVSTDYWANQLSQRLGYAVTAGEPYYTTGCLSSRQCVFPNAQIPAAIWSAPAKALMQYIPQPNVASNLFSDSAENEILGDHKGSARFDLKTPLGQLSAYYFLDQYNIDQPYPTAQGGANVPGFNAASQGRAQLISLNLTHVFGANAINDARFSYMRFANVIGQPVGGVGPTLASQGFVEGPGHARHRASQPRYRRHRERGVQRLHHRRGRHGRAPGQQHLPVERHLFPRHRQAHAEAGRQLSSRPGQHPLQFDQQRLVRLSGNGDRLGLRRLPSGSRQHLRTGRRQFLLHSQSLHRGVRAGQLASPSQLDSQLRYSLGRAAALAREVQPAPDLCSRTAVGGLSRRAAGHRLPRRSREFLRPWHPPSGTTFRRASAFRGRQTSIAESSVGCWRSRANCVNAGFGIFYTAFEGLSAGIMSACPPYGYDYDSTSGHPSFTRAISVGNHRADQRPAVSFADSSVRRFASHPNSTVDWSKYTPITGDPAFYYRNTSPYTESYTLSVERELTPSTVLKVGYVGTQAHHLLVLTSADPGNANLCLSVSEPNQVMPGTPTCGPFSEGGIFTRADGTKVQVRGPFGSAFDGITYQKTVGFSNYNALEVSLHHSSRSLQIAAAYTYGKSLDDSSSLSEPVYPSNAALSKAISAFDLRHNFVVSYDYQLPLTTLFRRVEPADGRMVGERHHAVCQRSAGNALQQHRQFPAGLDPQRY